MESEQLARENRNEDDSDEKEQMYDFVENEELDADKESQKIPGLPEDIYTLLFVAPYFSKPYLAGLMTFALQILVLCLFLFSMLGNGTETNKLKIPLRVSAIVSVCQFFALFIAWLDQLEELATFQNIRGIKKFEHHPSGNDKNFSKSRFLIANILRQLVSIIVLVVTFFFVIQSADVINLFLNFIAIAFIGKIDNTLYLLLKGGAICIDSGLKEYTTKVGKIRVISKSKKKSYSYLMTIGLLLVLLSMMSYVKYLQQSNNYQRLHCQNFELNVQDHTLFNFFDKVLPHCPNTTLYWEDWGRKYKHKQLDYREFNGRYTSLDKNNELGQLTRNRPTYYQEGPERSDPMAPIGQISFCRGSRRWVFSIPGVSKGIEADKDGCEWLMRSKVTSAYSLDEVSTEGWEIWSGPHTGLVQTISDQTFLQCSHCKDDTDCNYHGKCLKDYGSKKKCVCEPDWSGNTCNQCSGCKELYLFEGTDPGLAPYFKFSIFKNVTAYGRSIYVSKLGYTLSYTGAKFIVTGECEGHCYNEPQCKEIQGCDYDDDEGCHSVHENFTNHFDFSSYHSLWGSTPIIESEYTNRENPSKGLMWTISKNGCTSKEETSFVIKCGSGKDKCGDDSSDSGDEGGQNNGGNGEEVCEGHSYNEEVCNNIGCCFYGSGECWSSIGQAECINNDGSGDNGDDRGQDNGGNGEEVCEGHSYNEEDCNNIGCCFYGSDECWSSIGQDECI